jgi:hypothetical protein
MGQEQDAHVRAWREMSARIDFEPNDAGEVQDIVIPNCVFTLTGSAYLVQQNLNCGTMTE